MFQKRNSRPLTQIFAGTLYEWKWFSLILYEEKTEIIFP